jgi:hypothetical protein
MRTGFVKAQAQFRMYREKKRYSEKVINKIVNDPFRSKEIIIVYLNIIAKRKE